MLRHLGSAVMALVLMAGVAAAQPTNDINGNHRVPEPTMLALLAVGAGGIAWRAYKRKQRK